MFFKDLASLRFMQCYNSECAEQHFNVTYILHFFSNVAFLIFPSLIVWFQFVLQYWVLRFILCTSLMERVHQDYSVLGPGQTFRTEGVAEFLNSCSQIQAGWWGIKAGCRLGLGWLPVCEGPSQAEPLPPCPPGTEQSQVRLVTTPVKEKRVKWTASMVSGF